MAGTELRLDSALAGLIVPDPLISADTLVAIGTSPDSTHALGSPTPGSPVFSPTLTSVAGTHGARGPDLRLQLSGNQADDLTIRCQRGGMPGAGCEVVVGVADATVSSSDPIADERRWYGWSTPNVIEQISEEVLDKGIDLPQNLGGVETVDGRICYVYGNMGKLTARRFDPATLEWDGAAVDIADDTEPMNADGAIPTHVTSYCDVVRLGSGRLLVASLIQNNELDYEVVTHWSDDHGETWRSASWNGVDVAVDPVAVTLDGLRMCYDPASDTCLLLLATVYDLGQGPKNGWIQYASDDAGASWYLIEDWADGESSDEIGRPAIVASPIGAGFIVLYVAPTGVTRNLFQRRIASPFSPLRDATAETAVSTLVSGGNYPEDVTAFTDGTGRIWAAWSPTGAAAQVAYTANNGDTWARLTTPLYEPTTTTGLDRLFGVPFGCVADGAFAGVIWALGDTANGARADYQFVLACAGGWRAMCQPRVAGGWPYELRAWDVDWVPLYAPSVSGWANSGGAGSLPGTGAWRLTLSATPSSYGRNITGTTAAGLIFQCEVSAVSGAGVVAFDHGIRLRIGSVEAQVRISGANIALYDVAAGAQIGSNYAVDFLNHRWVVRVAIKGAGVACAVYVRRADQTTWALAVTGNLATTSATTDSITWGIFATSGTMSATWHHVAYTLTGGTGTAGGVATSPAFGTLLTGAPDSLPGAPLPGSAPLPGLVDGGGLPTPGGGLLRASSGPGLRGEVWEVALSDAHPVAAALDRISPTYLETATDDAQRIVWEPAGGYAHHPGGNAVGVAVFGANFGSAILQGWSGSAWVDVAELDLALTGLAFTRSGDTVRPASGGTAYGWQDARDLVGATFDLGGGDLRRVKAATSGCWNAGNAASCSLQLEGIDGTEATSGTGVLWVQTGVAVALGATTAYSRWGLYLPAQTTRTGTFQVRAIRVGSYLPFGARYSNGRIISTEARTEIADTPGAESGRVLGPPARRIQVAWVEGVPTRRHLTAPAHQAAGGIPLVGAGDVSLGEVLQESVGGRAGQVVYVSRLAHDPAASAAEVIAMRGRDYAVLCTMEGPIQRENLIGDEDAREAVRVSGLTLVEEVLP